MKSLTQMLVVLLAASLLFSCSQAGRAQEKEPAKPEVLTNIKIRTLAPQTLRETISLSGTVLPDRDVTFSAETPGRVERLSVDLGDRVRKGAVLARIDYEMLKAQRDQAQASYALAARTLQRLKKLSSEDLASKQQLDEAVTREQNAQAGLQIAEAQLNKSIVRATLSGIVARRMVDEGEYVNPGQPLLQIVDFSTVIVTAQVPEKLVGRIKRNMPVNIRIGSIDQDIQGQVHVVVPAAHPTSRTFELRVKAKNTGYQILIGMAARLRIIAQEHKDVLAVPMDAVVQSGNEHNVFVEKDGVVHERRVLTGPVDQDQVMIKQGLSVGERLVVEGQRDLFDGQRVRVVSDLALAPEKPASNPS